MQNNQPTFDTSPVSKSILKNAIPAIAAMVMVLIYNLADTFFIGQTNDALKVAAVSIATPVFLIFMAVGAIFGVGGTSVISRAIGQGRRDYARKVSAFCMWGCVLVGATMSVLFWSLMEPILMLIGASPDIWEMTKTYLNIVVLSGPFVLIATCYSNIIRAEGQPAKAMMGMLTGNLINIVLDPVLILGFGWHVAGAAIATVIGNVVGALYYIVYLLRGKTILSIHPRDFTLKEGVSRGVLAIGIPASLGTVLMSVSQIIMNSQMAAYGDMALAGIGVAMKVTMITGMVCIGLGQGVQPLLGYCVGAKNWDRFRAIIKCALGYAIVLGMGLTLICYLFTEPIVRAFLTDESAFEYGTQFARILLSTSALFGIFYVLINALQAMGAATSSLIISISRQGFIYIPALFLLNYLMGINGLVWAQPLADTLSICLAGILFYSTYQKMTEEMPHTKFRLKSSLQQN